MKLSEIVNPSEHPLDFFHGLTKLSRIFAGYPQEYGFHHHCNKDEYHGTFVTKDCRGKVYKQPYNGSAVYTCKFDDENLHDKHTRHEQVTDAVKASAPSVWNNVSHEDFKNTNEPCYCVIHGENPGDIEFHVHQDFHPSIK